MTRLALATLAALVATLATSPPAPQVPDWLPAVCAAGLWKECK